MKKGNKNITRTLEDKTVNKRKVLIVTLEPIAKQMAGPAIRAYELARELANEFAVSVFSPYPTDLPRPDNFSLACGLNKQKLYHLAQGSDVIFMQSNVLKPYPHLAKLNKFLAIDLYDPYLLSLLAQYEQDSFSVQASYRLMHKVLEAHMSVCDFAVCASERQRDYWIGRFCALGRLTPEMYKFDPSFRKLIDVVPYGLPNQAPVKNGPGIKGVVDGISKEDKVIIWGGGIWEWFDPLTIISAIGKISQTRKDVKLFFMGVKSPNPQVPEMGMVARTRKLADTLGVLNKNVFFGNSQQSQSPGSPNWISYDSRVNYLLDADIAVSAHFDLPETRFSFRTRILDYLWTELPIVTTGGDQFAELITLRSAGISVPYSDVDAWVKALTTILDNPELAKKFRQGTKDLAQEFTWEKAAKPLIEFCREPHRLPRHQKITMPSLAERARAVYERGGKDLIIQRSKALIDDLMRG